MNADNQDNNQRILKLQCWTDVKCIFPTYIQVTKNEKEHTNQAWGSFLQPPHGTREKLGHYN